MSVTTDAKYTIGSVARLTGLTTHAIRMWERRYGAVIADRAENGRRIYNAHDVEKLSLLKILTDGGAGISSIANLDLDELRERAKHDDEIKDSVSSDNIRIAILGGFVSGLMAQTDPVANGINIVVSGSSLRRFRADLVQANIEILVLEADIIDESAISHIRQLQKSGKAARVLVVYGFARSGHLTQLQKLGVSLLRMPVSGEELLIAIRAAASGMNTADRMAGVSAGVEHGASQTATLASGTDIPPRRYSIDQLSALSQIESTVDCECPQNLAIILNTLGAFEVYSQGCANSSKEDAALHTFLHASTSRARAIMEEALARVIEADNLTI